MSIHRRPSGAIHERIACGRNELVVLGPDAEHGAVAVQSIDGLVFVSLSLSRNEARRLGEVLIACADDAVPAAGGGR